MRRNKRSSNIEVEDGIEVYKIKDSMSSIERIEEAVPLVNIRDYLSKFQVKNLVKKK